MMLGQFLVEADVPLGVIVSENGANATKKNGYSLVASREAMVEILEKGDVLAMLFQRLQGLGHVVFGTGLIHIRKKSLLVNTIVVGQAYEALDRFTWLGGTSQWREGLHHGQGYGYTGPLEKTSSIQKVHHKAILILTILL